MRLCSDPDGTLRALACAFIAAGMFLGGMVVQAVRQRWRERQ